MAVLHISTAFPATVVRRFFTSLSSEALTQPLQPPSGPPSAPDRPAAQQGMAGVHLWTSCWVPLAQAQLGGCQTL